MAFEFQCASCGEIHRGMPTFRSEAPLGYLDVPEDEHAERCQLGDISCIIDNQHFYIYGCIEIPVHGYHQPLSWGVWVSISHGRYKDWQAHQHDPQATKAEPFFGWLNTWLQPYPNTINLKTRVHLRDNGMPPYIEIEPTDHPLAVEQREGITPERVAELYIQVAHAAELSE